MEIGAFFGAHLQKLFESKIQGGIDSGIEWTESRTPCSEAEITPGDRE